MMAEELKPCPFCGAEAVKGTIKPFDQVAGMKYFVQCSRVRTWTHEVCMCGKTEEEVVRMWNHRAADERMEDDLK